MRIKDLGNTATEADLVVGKYLAIDGNDGTAKLPAEILGNIETSIAPIFVPNSTTTIAGKPYIYNGSLYLAKEAYQGVWSASKFVKTSVDYLLDNKLSVKQCPEKGLQIVKTFGESDLNWISNKVVASHTGNVNDGTYKITSVDVSGVNVVKLTIPVFYRADHSGMAFYDIGGNYISGMSVNRAFVEGFWKVCLIVPQNAVELKTSWYQSGYDNDFELETFICSENLSNNIAKFDSSVVADGYIHQNDGTVTSGAWSANLGEAQYIPCHGASYIKTNLVIFTSARNGGVCFFDENKDFLYCFNRNQGATPSLESDVVVPVPDNAYYACILSFNYEKSLLYGFFACEIVYPFNILKKRDYENGYIHYSVVVNQTPNDWWKSSATPSTPSYKRSTGVLLLPTNYKPEGKPTKLIVFCHGSTRNVTSIQWGLNNVNFLAQKQRYADAGYAVLDCNGPCDNGGNPMIGVGSPQAFGAYKKCIEWACDNFNIDPHPYIIGASAGGVVSFNLARTIQASALCLLSPNIDLKSFWDSGNKSVFVTFYGFTDTTTWEAEKCLGYDMYGTIVDGVSRFVKCPIQLWRGSLESGGVEYPKMEAFVNALRSAGSIAALRTLEGADHSITNGGNPDCDQEVLDWFNRF